MQAALQHLLVLPGVLLLLAAVSTGPAAAVLPPENPTSIIKDWTDWQSRTIMQVTPAGRLGGSGNHLPLRGKGSGGSSNTIVVAVVVVLVVTSSVRRL